MTGGIRNIWIRCNCAIFCSSLWNLTCKITPCLTFIHNTLKCWWFFKLLLELRSIGRSKQHKHIFLVNPILLIFRPRNRILKSHIRENQMVFADFFSHRLSLAGMFWGCWMELYFKAGQRLKTTHLSCILMFNNQTQDLFSIFWYGYTVESYTYLSSNNSLTEHNMGQHKIH